MDGWDVLGDPLMVVELLAQWKPVLCEAESEEGNDHNPLMKANSDAAFYALFSEYVLPKIRQAIVNYWEVSF